MSVTWTQLEVAWRSSTNRTLAVIRHDPGALERRLGVKWIRGTDELDDFDFAVLRTPSGNVFALRRYVGMLTPGTEVVVELGLNLPESTLTEALACIGMTEEDASWIAG